MALRVLASAGGSAPLDQLLSTIPSLPRPLLDRLVARMIEHLDDLDGDADHEEPDLEDSFVLSWYTRALDGPGCPISDPGGGDVVDKPHDGESDL
jgi:hypothetical protein